MFLLACVSSSLEFWSVNQTSIYENSELKFFKNIKFLGEVSNNSTKDLLGKSKYKTLKSSWWSLAGNCKIEF